MKSQNLYLGASTLALSLYESAGRFMSHRGLKLRIKPSESLSRHFWTPAMGQDLSSLIEYGVFPFSNGNAESLVWRRFSPFISCVNGLGQAYERRAQESGRGKRYGGFLTAQTEALANYRTAKGHGFIVYHDPAEGIHHVHIELLPAVGQKILKGERSELRIALAQQLFSQRTLG